MSLQLGIEHCAREDYLIQNIAEEYEWIHVPPKRINPEALTTLFLLTQQKELESAIEKHGEFKRTGSDLDVAGENTRARFFISTRDTQTTQKNLGYDIPFSYLLREVSSSPTLCHGKKLTNQRSIYEPISEKNPNLLKEVPHHHERHGNLVSRNRFSIPFHKAIIIFELNLKDIHKRFQKSFVCRDIIGEPGYKVCLSLPYQMSKFLARADVNCALIILQLNSPIHTLSFSSTITFMQNRKLTQED